jgi:hypothetical protein
MAATQAPSVTDDSVRILQNVTRGLRRFRVSIVIRISRLFFRLWFICFWTSYFLLIVEYGTGIRFI